ncbi:MAG: hypothetical protein KBC90_17870 [Spirochaetes bacterium]|nr:hypothetical protein [Spirochaetota bacterium]HOD16917.1 hypothetical protein [Spirochaetota bacterium]
MKQNHWLICVLAVSLCLLTACNSLSSSNSLLALLGLGGGGAPAGMFTKQFGTTATSSILLFENDRDGKSQFLYTAAEVNGSGLITTIRLRHVPDVPAEVINQNVTIRMGHTNLTGLSTTWANNVQTGQGSLVTVLDDKTVTIPVGPENSWFDITLDTPFNYNGVDNLVVEIARSTYCTAAIDVTYFQAANARRAWSRGNMPDVAGTPDYNTTTATAADQYQPWMQFVFAGGDNAIINSGNNNGVPFYSGINKRIQLLYDKDRINASGSISGVGFILGVLSSGMESTITVRLGHTSLDTLVDTSWNANFNSGNPVTVANAAVFRVPNGAPAGSTIWLPLSKSFNYNGTDNLVVEVTVTALTGETNLEMNTSGNLTRLIGTAEAPVSSFDNAQYSIRLRFKGGTADVITNSNGCSSLPFNHEVSGQLQPLYLSSELGIYGRITAMSFRLDNDESFADSYPDFKIVLGHTDESSQVIGDPYENIMEDPVTVFNGTVSVALGLKEGDWIDIPFSTPFSVVPGKNLLLHILSGAGTNIATSDDNEIDIETTPGRFVDRTVLSNDDPAAYPEFIGDYLYSIRFTLE